MDLPHRKVFGLQVFSDLSDQLIGYGVRRPAAPIAVPQEAE